MIDVLPVINLAVLKDMPKSKAKGHACSAISIWNAGVFANDPRACMLEADRLHLPRKKWRDIQSASKKIIEDCTRLGITFEKPYRWKDNKLYVVRHSGVYCVYDAITKTGIYDNKAKGTENDANQQPN